MSSTHIEEAGIEAMRRSLATMAQLLHERDAEISRLKDEQLRTGKECTRLRKEINELHARKAESMMDLALEAGTRAISEEAEESRRHAAETRVIASELQLVERAAFDGTQGVTTSAATAALVRAQFEQGPTLKGGSLW